MKRILISLMLLAITAVPSTAQDGQIQLYLGGGVTTTFSPDQFSRWYNVGYVVGAEGGYMLNELAELTLGITYGQLPLNERTFLDSHEPDAQGLSVNGGELSVWTGSLGTKYRLHTIASLSSYALIRFGLARLAVSNGGIVGPELSEPFEGKTEMQSQASLGVGSIFQLSPRLNLFLEAAYDVIFTPDETTQLLPVKAGLVIRAN